MDATSCIALQDFFDTEGYYFDENGEDENGGYDNEERIYIASTIEEKEDDQLLENSKVNAKKRKEKWKSQSIHYQHTSYLK